MTRSTQGSSAYETGAGIERLRHRRVRLRQPLQVVHAFLAAEFDGAGLVENPSGPDSYRFAEQHREHLGRT